MQSLSAEQIVQLWELGQGQHPLDRALTCLAMALPGRSLEDLAALSLGRRDSYLLTLRELTFGPRLNSVASCPYCQETVEFVLSIEDIRISPSDPKEEPSLCWQASDTQVKFRLPNSLDLAATLGLETIESAREALLERCVLAASHLGQATTVAQLPPVVRNELGQAITQADPQADIKLDLSCPACSHSWQLVFDIGEFLWAEITTTAQRLLLDIHRLASAYKWREADILGMSNQRRQYYLNLVS